MPFNAWGALAEIALDPGGTYRVSYVNPGTGRTVEAGTAKAGANGLWQPPGKPSYADWVLGGIP